MIKHNFNKILTVMLVIIIFAIIVVLGFWGYDFFQRHFLNVQANEVLDNFDKQISELNIIIGQNVTLPSVQNNVINNDISNVTNTSTQNSNSTSQGGSTTPKRNIELKYKGYDVAGKIEIPAINLKYPVLTVATDSSMKISVGVLYGVGLNKIGNTVIMGHNYRNGSLFSNNDKLKNGDEIFITDTSGERLRYIIYNKYYTTSTDFEYGTRDTAGRREITLESCTDDGRSRVIIWAKEE